MEATCVECMEGLYLFNNDQCIPEGYRITSGALALTATTNCLQENNAAECTKCMATHMVLDSAFAGTVTCFLISHANYTGTEGFTVTTIAARCTKLNEPTTGDYKCNASSCKTGFRIHDGLCLAEGKYFNKNTDTEIDLPSFCAEALYVTASTSIECSSCTTGAYFSSAYK